MARNALKALSLKSALIPLAPDCEQQAIPWRYTFTQPVTNWADPGLDDHSWQIGPGLFGHAYYQPRTYWDPRSTNIWLRREFDLADLPSSGVVFRAKYDDEIEVFLNGVEAARATGIAWTAGAYWLLPCSPAARAALRPGRNVVAVHVRNLTDNACADLGVYAAPEWRSGLLRFTSVFDEALAKRPGNLALLEQRANLLAQCGEWDEAAVGYTALTELQPTNYSFYGALASLLVQSGDTPGYDRLRGQMLTRYGATTDPMTAEATAKACLLLPASGAELPTAVRLADTAASADTNHWAWTYFQFVKGLVEYRQGHFSAAQQCLDPVLAKTGEDRKRDVQAYAVLAMASLRLGETNRAQTALSQGNEIAEKDLPGPESGDLDDTPQDWITANVLLQEARKLVLKPPVVKEAAK